MGNFGHCFTFLPVWHFWHFWSFWQFWPFWHFEELNKYKEEFCIDQRYAPQIFAKIFAVILAQSSKYHKYLRRKKRKYMHCKYLRKYWRNAKNTANIGANI